MARKIKNNSIEDDLSDEITDESMARPRLLPLVLPRILGDEDKNNGYMLKEIRGKKLLKKKGNNYSNNLTNNIAGSLLLGYRKREYSSEKDKENWSLARKLLCRPPKYESSFSVSPLGKAISCPVDSFSPSQGQRSNKLILPQILTGPKRDNRESFGGFYLDSTERSSQRDTGDLVILRAKQRAEFEKRINKRKKLKETHKLRTEDVGRSLVCARLHKHQLKIPEEDRQYRLKLNNCSTEKIISEDKYCSNRKISLRAPPTTPNFEDRETDISYITPIDIQTVNHFDYGISIPNTSP